MFKYLFVLLFAAAVFFVIVFIYNNLIMTKKYRITTQKNIKPLRIVLITDLHNKRFGKGNARLLARIRECDPDMIVVAGDTVDRRRPDFNISREFLKDISKLCDTYYVTGNHERALGIENCGNQLDCRPLLLDNDYKILYDYAVLGLPDRIGGDDSDIRDTLLAFERLDVFKIVAVHRPLEFYDHLKLRERDIDLLLCGHTHGGAVRIPFFGAFFSPDEGFFPKYARGHYKENGTDMIVSGGLGSTMLPIRFHNFPQIVVVEIENAKKAYAQKKELLCSQFFGGSTPMR